MSSDDENSDQTQWRAWHRGDRAAAESLIARHGPSLYTFLASKVAQGADALCQQIFAEVRDGDEPADGVRVRLFQLARRSLLAHLRERHGDFDPGQQALARLDQGVSEVMAVSDEQRQLTHALRVLPLDDQVMLELHYWEGLSSAEIGVVLGEPVEQRLADARHRLEVELRARHERADHTVDAGGTEGG